ncbi:signal peptide peptidase SppA [Desulfobacter hydrogenophilus]|uniref:Signal peptide peptidase SppA n=1 Tax=Desulfobacter hydrogenophilus TaxID=2291 RepID=A0A328FD92_9BACT|nr:signal peptide peptidase SppA [Desulfobacter hydrogenophilus]NDY73469.1 signal peptide peptidase SppA [Desulfobacter hydrogenophilus]QBH14405.1 signal peptide peptidase SppA [Desulfobacter hydrogenophilus]RAM02269.1 signal peptide peptidase SppA [Desulfobacter hydrogenophilus]
MFARRHPFLFFLCVICACFTLGLVAVSGVAVIGAFAVNSEIRSAIASTKGNIGVVEVTGPIISSKKIIQDFQGFMNDDAIKAIILRVDSPGGGIGPSQEIYRELMKNRDTKIVIASMGSVAASGGYYIACATQGIVANSGTITGSIGVIMEYANLEQIAEKIGISPVVIKSGEYKDMGSPMRKLKDSEKKLFQHLVDELHAQFVFDAAAARNMETDVMAKLADGRVYTGQTAMKLKLVDRIGNLDDAVQWAGQMAGIEGELTPVYPKADKMTLFKKLAETLFQDVNLGTRLSEQLRYVFN